MYASVSTACRTSRSTRRGPPSPSGAVGRRGSTWALGFTGDPLVLQALEIIAVLTGTLFAGAALYINAVEHPARMLLDTKSAALQWAPSYKRATFVQAPLALISFACGSLAWLSGASIWWLVAALLMGAVVRLWTRGKAGIERVLRLPCAVLFRNAVERAESLLEKR